MRVLLLLISMASAVATESEQKFRDYLMSNPEVVWQSLELYKYQVQQDKLKRIVSSEESQIVIENPRGKDELIMFVDYRCGACRRVYPWVENFVKRHENVKLTIKPYPVLGTESMQAALMVYDAEKLELAPEMHRKLIDSKHSFSLARLRELGKEYEINVQLPSSLNKHWAFPLLEKNHQDSLDLENQTVPMFIISVGDKYLMLKGLSSKGELDEVYNQMS